MLASDRSESNDCLLPRNSHQLAGDLFFQGHWFAVPCLKLRGGHALRLLDPKAEIWAYHSIWQERCYDRDFADIPRNGTVIDLGANVGIFALYAGTKLVPDGAVLAVEPNPDCETLLRQNCATLHNVTVLQASIGGDGHLHLTNDSLGASVFASDETVRTISCPVISPEDVLTRFPRVDLLKVNMEGAEYPFVLDTRAEFGSQCSALP